MNSVILEANEIEFTYPGHVKALNKLNLQIRKSRRLAVLGPNGAGKTTLLLHLNGTLKPQKGRILLDGLPARYNRDAKKSWRRRVGLVLQDADDQLFSANVYQDVTFGPLNLGLSEEETRERVRDTLKALDIESLAERPTHMLSFGQKKRVAIAGIAAMKPEVLILDEPTAGLDTRGVKNLLDLLEKLFRNGTTLVFATHDLDLACLWADEIAVFSEGRVLRQGPTEDILADREFLQQAGVEPTPFLDLALQLHDAGYGWVEAGSTESKRKALQQILGMLTKTPTQGEEEPPK